MDEQAKKKTLRMVPYGLYVVGVRRKDVTSLEEDVNAIIGSWVTQTSFDPPMLVACLKKDSSAWHHVTESGVFTLNVLGAGQKALASKFLKKTMTVHAKSDAEGTMEGVPFRLEEKTRCPVFPDIPAWVACEVVHSYDGENDHTVFVARVVDAGVHHEGDLAPLSHEETGWTYAG